MTVSSATPTATAAPAKSASSAATSAAGSLTSAADQEDRFMKLLVAQMKNQDPLNPMDNAQMTSQIAQINTVGGIEKLNITVSSLLAAFNSLQAQSAQQLPGRSVLVEGSALTLDEAGATGGVELAAAADKTTVEIVDSAGRSVRTLALGKSSAGARSFAWDGRGDDGQSAPVGTYRIRVAASAAGKDVGITALTAARVESVSSGSGSSGVQVDLGAAGTRAYSDIKSFL
jgi:flagellar basal-body rod modification protein FlgD